MKIPDHSEIELYPIQNSESDVIIQSSFSKKIRGSNFKDQATIFIDTKQREWLWKKLPPFSLIQEYIVSSLAFDLGIHVPRSILARRGHSIGLIQEWIDCKDLPSFCDDHQTLNNNKTELLDLFVFEAWIGALDRHGGNYLTSREGKLWAIDFEQSFSKTNFGSELCLYFPWIKDSKNELEKSIKKVIIQTNERQLLERNFLNIVNFPQDPRAREALKHQLTKIFELLKNNLAQLDKIVDTYLENSFSKPEFIQYT